MEVEVQKNGLLLQICPDELRADPSFVKLAVSQNGEALQYALEPARSNMDVNLTAIGQTFKALQYVPTALRMNNQFLSEAIKRALLNDPTAEAFIMDCIPPEKFLDDAFAPLVLPLLPKLLPRFSENVRANKALVLPVLAKIGGYLSWVSEQLKLDTEVYLTAIQNDTSAYYSIPKSVLEDPAAVCTIVAANKNVYDLLPPKWQKDLRVMIAAGRILD
jgi:hypothetical protein